MLDDFREWLSDNLRYILLGLAVILILVIAFFAIRLVTRVGKPKEEKQTEAVTEQPVTETEASGSENKMVRESADSPIQTLMTSYYTAMAAKDYDTLATLDLAFDEEEKAKIETTAIESYNNIITYSKAGLTEGTYIVYVYFDAKLSGIETLAPSLWEEYVVTNADGSLALGDKKSSQELADYLLEMQEDPEVQALVQDVNEKMEQAKAKDADLAAYVDSPGTAQPQTGDGDTGSTDNAQTGTGESVGTMQATTAVNVRAEASAESTQYGALYAGMQVEVLEHLNNGWSHIRYSAEGTTIEGYVMTQYLSAVN